MKDSGMFRPGNLHSYEREKNKPILTLRQVFATTFRDTASAGKLDSGSEAREVERENFQARSPGIGQL